MNIPTNKLKDLIATLQTFDQDVDHHYTEAEVFVTKAGRRYIHLKYDQDTYIPIAKLLDDLYVELSTDDYDIVYDANTVEEFKTALINHLAALHARINELQDFIK